ncbi:hypothetical protein SAMN05216464_108251 [Mucilaginibacter pineti]|uniref:Uncharacterized protein n=1 Tax=Mucilaginibacter pineti TaxID=1391627 RepID=A0A1G7F1F4_9SPHI|nr:hypothetical protein SAMN05216464_108251 [Mucilaginibacter pineti]
MKEFTIIQTTLHATNRYTNITDFCICLQLDYKCNRCDTNNASVFENNHFTGLDEKSAMAYFIAPRQIYFFKNSNGKALPAPNTAPVATSVG